MASSSSGGYVSRYDVFLSFRGEDTRETFTDHLYDRLSRAGIYTFRDNNSIRIGEDLKPEFQRGIRESRASIIILSKEYATSRWCLDELCLILEQRRERNHFVLPVFYHVDPSHVRKQEGTFQINIKPDTKWTEANVERWKAALEKVGNMAGKVATSGSEVEFSQEIVNIITTELNLTQVYRQRNLVGMETRDKEINNWLEQSDDEILAIWGIDGGGKTTLARHIVYSNWQKFESVSILEDIGGTSTEALRQLQEKLSRDIIEGKEKTIPSVCQGTYTIQNALKKRKAIIVLDNIVTKEQVDMLLGSGSETETDETKVRSKIIITTTEKNASKWFRSTSWRCKEHEIKLLDEGDSLKLLKHYAFEPNVSMEGYDELVKRALLYCQGYPLALKVCGSFLYCDSSHSSESRKQFWESMMTSLERQVPDSIQSVLMTSYNSLQLHSVKELFLHIACFFNGKDKDYVQKILEPEYYAKSGIVTLTNSCLLSVSPNNELRMHPLIQEMGRTIILAESPRLPGERSRIWRDKESHEVLSKGNGSTKVEGLALDMEMLRQQSDKGRRKLPDSVKTESIGKMNYLKLLQLNQLELTGSYENILKDLRWLCWRESHLKTIPRTLHMEKLVCIDMSRSKLKVFEPPNVLPLLKVLNLTDSDDLVEIKNISRFPNLETLILVHCRKLVRVSDTLGADLTSLTLLDITGCENLCMRKQPKSYERIKVSLFGGQNTKQPHFLLPNSLKQLLLMDCNLKDTHYFPLSLKNQSQLEYLNLARNPFELLPSYTHLNNLRVLDLSGCRALKRLLCLPSQLAELYIFFCDSLKSVTFESHKYTLQEFRYEGCVNLSEVEDFFKFVPVAMLTEADLGHMNWLRAYQDLEVCMVGDEDLTQGRSLCLQMLYEFNIMSISLPDIEQLNIIPEYEYTSDDSLLSFKVPERSSNRTLKGLNITFMYTIQGDEWVWFAKIRTSKGVDLIYNPKAFGKPATDKVGIWLSYWPIGESLQDGDEVNVAIVVMKGNLMIQGCGASLVYTDEIESFQHSNESMVDANESYEDNDESFEEKNAHADTLGADILGADISGFKLSNGTYYLCRRDYSQLMEVGRLNPNWFRNLVGDTIDYTEIGGWRKTGRPNKPYQSFKELKNIRCTIYGPQSNEFYTIEELTKSSLVDEDVEFTEFSDKTKKSVDIRESMESTSSSLTELTKYSGPPFRNSAGKEGVKEMTSRRPSILRRSSTQTQTELPTQEDQIRGYRQMARSIYQAARTTRRVFGRNNYNQTLESVVDPERQLEISRERRASLVPGEVLYSNNRSTRRHRVYEHYSEQRILCVSENQVNLRLCNQESYRSLRSSGLYIHLGIFMIRLHALHQRSAGTKALIVLRDTRWEDSRQIIGTKEVDLSPGTQLVYMVPDMVLSIDDFHNHVEVVIQTHGYETWQGGESNLLITMAMTGRLKETSSMGFQYSVENVVDHLTTNGITAIPGERRSVEELEGMSWNLKPSEQTSVRVPESFERYRNPRPARYSESFERYRNPQPARYSESFERYRNPQPARYSVDQHDREVLGKRSS